MVSTVPPHEGGRNTILVLESDAGEEVDYDDIEDAAECLINDIPYAGVGEEWE